MRITQTTPDRRLKLFFVRREFFAIVFNAISAGELIRLPISEGLPEGAEVVSVHEDWERAAFALVVWHPSFEEVPDAMQIPAGQPYFLPLQSFWHVPLEPVECSNPPSSE